MLSTSSLAELLSCRFGRKEELSTTINGIKLPPTNANNDNKKLIAIALMDRKVSHNYSYSKQLFFISCCLIVAANIQVNNSKAINNKFACICENIFYTDCPETCRKKHDNQLKVVSKHDITHPDHVIDEMSLSDLEGASFKDPYLNNNNNLDRSTGTGTVMRHRKVYLSDKQIKNAEPIIHPITIRIPVRVSKDKSLDLPEPKPVFKMRKYTYQETKPEIQMVPVKTTIIKPIGVSKEQIIDDIKIN